MIPEIEVFRPRDLNEALALLAQQGERAKVIAGGTDVIPGLQLGARRFQKLRALIDIHHLPELRSIRLEKGVLRIGAAATFSDIVHSPAIAEKYPLLTQAAYGIGSVQIRNRATIAGNFVNNAPCADSVPALLVYDAEITIRSVNGERKISLSDFLIKPYGTQLQVNELVTEIALPELPGGYRG